MNIPLLAALAAVLIGGAAAGGYMVMKGGDSGYRLITYGGKAEDRVVGNVTPVCMTQDEAEAILNNGKEAGFKGLRWDVRGRALEPAKAAEIMHLHGYVVTTAACAATITGLYDPNGSGYGYYELIVETVD